MYLTEHGDVDMERIGTLTNEAFIAAPDGHGRRPVEKYTNPTTRPWPLDIYMEIDGDHPVIQSSGLRRAIM